MDCNEHSYKPPVQFFGKDSYFLGLELEVEAPNAVARTKGLALKRKPSYCYAKQDGSLDRAVGWELVTHPIARNLWLPGSESKLSAASKFFGLVKDLRELGYTSHSNTRCGLHIHVSHTAFACTQQQIVEEAAPRIRRLGEPISAVYESRNQRRQQVRCPHLYWFTRVVNSVLFKKLSQRMDEQVNRWTKIRQISAADFHTNGGDGRYVATNVTENTVEVRIFRGNMREDRIRKALESVISAVEYSRALRLEDYKAGKANPSHLMNGYLKFTASQPALYPNLLAYLKEIEVQTEEVSACVS